jgi:hypothetical protein
MLDFIILASVLVVAVLLKEIFDRLETTSAEIKDMSRDIGRIKEVIEEKTKPGWLPNDPARFPASFTSIQRTKSSRVS